MSVQIEKFEFAYDHAHMYTQNILSVCMCLAFY